MRVRIALFRALQLGDVLTALPALRAMRACFTHAHLTLVAQPWAIELPRRLPWLDDFIAFPGHPLLPEQAHDAAALERFEREVRARRFDLAVQMHGDGRITNGIVAGFGARLLAGFHPSGEASPDPAHFIPWPQSGREVERLIRLPLHLGASQPDTLVESLAILPADRAALELIWPGPHPPYVCVHPGARFPSRRWPAERFAQVAHALRQQGFAVVVTGSSGDSEAVSRMLDSAPKDVVDLCGRTNFGALTALLAGARLLVANDTGVSHLAAALRTPSVIVCCGGDAARWAPVDEDRHRVLAHPVGCRPCMHLHCPTSHECALGVKAAAVIEQTRIQLSRDYTKETLHAT